MTDSTVTAATGSSRFPSRYVWGALKIVGTVALTFLGLLLITFVIGRVVPVDPVLAAIAVDTGPTTP